jgi:hypothetical protein
MAQLLFFHLQALPPVQPLDKVRKTNFLKTAAKPVSTTTSKQRPPVNNGQPEEATSSLNITYTLYIMTTFIYGKFKFSLYLF